MTRQRVFARTNATQCDQLVKLCVRYSEIELIHTMTLPYSTRHATLLVKEAQSLPLNSRRNSRKSWCSNYLNSLYLIFCDARMVFNWCSKISFWKLWVHLLNVMNVMVIRTVPAVCIPSTLVTVDNPCRYHVLRVQYKFLVMDAEDPE